MLRLDKAKNCNWDCKPGVKITIKRAIITAVVQNTEKQLLAPHKSKALFSSSANFFSLLKKRNICRFIAVVIASLLSLNSLSAICIQSIFVFAHRIMCIRCSFWSASVNAQRTVIFDEEKEKERNCSDHFHSTSALQAHRRLGLSFICLRGIFYELDGDSFMRRFLPNAATRKIVAKKEMIWKSLLLTQSTKGIIIHSLQWWAEREDFHSQQYRQMWSVRCKSRNHAETERVTSFKSGFDELF